jgi:hypothetical protein
MSGTHMSTATATAPTKAACSGVVLRRGPRACPAKGREPVSRDAQQFAAVILEVLAGVRTPTEAATVLKVPLPRYYLWEQRALEGLVRACEPRPKGKAASERHQIAALEKEVGRLRQDCARQQALVRASHRTIGLSVSPQPAAKPVAKPGNKATVKASDGGKAKRKRRPVVRALKAVVALQASPGLSDNLADSSSANAAEVVQRSVPGSLSQPAVVAGAMAAVSEA